VRWLTVFSDGLRWAGGKKHSLGDQWSGPKADLQLTRILRGLRHLRAVDHTEALEGRRVNLVHQQGNGQERLRKPDISKAKDVFGLEPKTQLREGLTRTIAYFDSTLSEGAMPGASHCGG
jgi:hypothetical protein